MDWIKTTQLKLISSSQITTLSLGLALLSLCLVSCDNDHKREKKLKQVERKQLIDSVWAKYESTTSDLVNKIIIDDTTFHGDYIESCEALLFDGKTIDKQDHFDVGKKHLFHFSPDEFDLLRLPDGRIRYIFDDWMHGARFQINCPDSHQDFYHSYQKLADVFASPNFVVYGEVDHDGSIFTDSDGDSMMIVNVSCSAFTLSGEPRKLYDVIRKKTHNDLLNDPLGIR